MTNFFMEKLSRCGTDPKTAFQKSGAEDPVLFYPQIWKNNHTERIGGNTPSGRYAGHPGYFRQWISL